MIFTEGKDTFVVKLSPDKVVFVRDVMDDIERHIRGNEVEDGYRIED